MKKLFLILLLLNIFFITRIYGYQGDYMSYLQVGFDAQSAALRNSNVCNMTGFDAVYFSPASLSGNKRTEVSVGYANLYNQGIKYDVVGTAFKYKSYGIGTGFVYVTTDEMKAYNQYAQEISSFKPFQLSYFVGAGRKIGKWSYAGVSTTISIENLYDDLKVGAGLNMSVIMELDKRNELSLIIRNIFGPSVRYAAKNAAPLTYGAGFSRKIGGKSDLYFTYLAPEGYKVGLKSRLNKYLTFSSGMDNNNYSSGIKIRMRRAFLDITFIYTKNLSYYLFGSLSLNL